MYKDYLKICCDKNSIKNFYNSDTFQYFFGNVQQHQLELFHKLQYDSYTLTTFVISYDQSSLTKL